MENSFESQQRQLQEAISEIYETLGRELQPAVKHIIRYVVWLQRYQLYVTLPYWIPDLLSWWIAQLCPRRWLPKLDANVFSPDRFKQPTP